MNFKICHENDDLYIQTNSRQQIMNYSNNFYVPI